MSFSGILGRRPISAKNIFFARHNFKMLRIETATILAKMIEFHIFWGRFDQKLIRDAMCPHIFTINPDEAVSLAKSSLPFPAIF